jgi:predicted TIM-barrel fold metal-dependent hydrolase
VTRLRDLLGLDKILWATDFPHQESEFPHSDRVIGKNFDGVPEAEVAQIVAGNAIRFFRLDATVAPAEGHWPRVSSVALT